MWDGSTAVFVPQIQTTGELNTPRGGHSMLAFEVLGIKLLYVVGGCTSYTATGALGSVETFNGSSWSTHAAELIVPRSYFGLAVYAGKMYAAGGYNDGAVPLASVEAFDGLTWENLLLSRGITLVLPIAAMGVATVPAPGGSCEVETGPVLFECHDSAVVHPRQVEIATQVASSGVAPHGWKLKPYCYMCECQFVDYGCAEKCKDKYGCRVCGNKEDWGERRVRVRACA